MRAVDVSAAVVVGALVVVGTNLRRCSSASEPVMAGMVTRTQTRDSLHAASLVGSVEEAAVEVMAVLKFVERGRKEH